MVEGWPSSLIDLDSAAVEIDWLIHLQAGLLTKRFTLIDKTTIISSD